VTVRLCTRGNSYHKYGEHSVFRRLYVRTGVSRGEMDLLDLARVVRPVEQVGLEVERPEIAHPSGLHSPVHFPPGTDLPHISSTVLYVRTGVSRGEMDLLDLARVVRPVEQVEATAGRSGLSDRRLRTPPACIRLCTFLQVLTYRTSLQQYLNLRSAGRRARSEVWRQGNQRTSILRKCTDDAKQESRNRRTISRPISVRPSKSR
jgi:hypothetical protein